MREEKQNTNFYNLEGGKKQREWQPIVEIPVHEKGKEKRWDAHSQAGRKTDSIPDSQWKSQVQYNNSFWPKFYVTRILSPFIAIITRISSKISKAISDNHRILELKGTLMSNNCLIFLHWQKYGTDKNKILFNI